MMSTGHNSVSLIYQDVKLRFLPEKFTILNCFFRKNLKSSFQQLAYRLIYCGLCVRVLSAASFAFVNENCGGNQIRVWCLIKYRVWDLEVRGHPEIIGRPRPINTTSTRGGKIANVEAIQQDISLQINHSS